MRQLIVLAAAMAVFAAAAGPAGAAIKKRHTAVLRSASGRVIEPTKTIIHNPNGSTTVIVVPRRSYLDPGTEVSVGDTSYRDYMLPPGGNPGEPNWFYGPDLTGSGGYPLRAFDIPGINPNTPF